MSHPSSPSPACPPPGTAVATPATSTVAWPDAARQTAFEAWLAPLVGPHQLLPATLRPASADASFRRYLRIDSAMGCSRIVMDAPPDKENCKPFVQVQGLMAAAGLNVPEILEFDEPTGFMLLSDLGHQTLIELLNPEKPQDAYAWYQQATDVLLDWQKASQPGVLPAYDEALLRRELALFPDWYLARHRSVTLDDKQQATLASAFDAIVAHNLAAPQVYVHRDFMTRNLMAPTEQGAPLGVLDFQDAVYGPITYDLASLLRDCYLTWDRQQVEAWAESHRRRLRAAQLIGADVDRERFRRWFDLIGLQRHIKVLGIFCRLHYRDGKHGYLADLPRVYDYVIEVAGRYPALAEFVVLLRRCVGPRDLRQPAAA